MTADHGGPSDEQLLARMAQGRDAQALAELIRRHEGTAFRLAHKLCGSRELAEEALQEAFLAIWEAAATYRPLGRPRSWILTIVVQKAIKQARTSSRRRRRDARAGQRSPGIAADPEPLTLAEGKELKDGLGHALRQLPATQRQLVALYYGAGLNQAQIAANLSISQRLVSLRLRNALEQLRYNLRQLGHLAKEGAEGILWLTEGLAAPSEPGPDLSASVLERIQAAPAPLRQGQAPWHMKWACRAGAVLLSATLVGAGIAWVGGLAESPTLPKPLTPRDRAVQTDNARRDPQSSQPHEDPWPPDREWRFDEGLPADLRILRGSPEWREPESGIPGQLIGEVGEDKRIFLRLPLKIPPRAADPYVFEFRIRPSGIWQIGAHQCGISEGRNHFIGSRGWLSKAHASYLTLLGEAVEYLDYFWECNRLSVVRTQERGNLAHIAVEHEGSLIPQGLVVALRGLELERIRIRPMAEAELEWVVRTASELKADPRSERRHFPQTAFPPNFEEADRR